MVTSFKRAYPISKSTAPRASAPAAVHCWPVPPQEAFKHSSVSVSVVSLGPDIKGGVKICLSPLSVTGGYGVWFKMWLLPSYHVSGASSLSLDVGYLLKIDPAPCSHHSNTVQPPLQCLLSCWRASLPLGMGYLLTVTPALHIYISLDTLYIIRILALCLYYNLQTLLCIICHFILLIFCHAQILRSLLGNQIIQFFFIASRFGV